MHVFRLRHATLCAMVAWAVGPAMAQDDVIGYIKTVQADASVVMAGQAVPAKPGMALQPGQTLKTGSTGAMGVVFKDNTSLSIGADTELVVDAYLFAPAKGELTLGLKMARGSLYYISGAIAKLKPESVSIKTPTGMIGVRGTEFLAKVDPQDKE